MMAAAATSESQGGRIRSIQPWARTCLETIVKENTEIEPDDKGCRQGMDTENKRCFSKEYTYHHRYQKVVLDIWWDIEVVPPNGYSDAEWREHNTLRS